MDEHRSRDAPASGTLDRELDLRALILSAVGLVAVLVVVGALTWLFAALLRQQAAEGDPRLPALPEARTPAPPPEPRLQTDPVGDLRRLRALEEALLETYGWTDREAGLARIPIGRAMDLVSEGHLPHSPGEAGSGGGASPQASTAEGVD